MTQVANTSTTLKGILSKIGLGSIQRPDCWSLIKVEKMLNDFGIKDFEIINQRKVVKLRSESDLKTILTYLMPNDISSDYHLSLSKVDGKALFRFACWQFEAEA